MRPFLSRSLPPLLLALHAGLLSWAIVGLIEWFVPTVPWPRLSNPLFPSWLLLLHWLAIAAAASVFLGGCALRWPHTARAMAASYAFMASVCVIETFGFLTHPLRHEHQQPFGCQAVDEHAELAEHPLSGMVANRAKASSRGMVSRQWSKCQLTS